MTNAEGRIPNPAAFPIEVGAGFRERGVVMDFAKKSRRTMLLCVLLSAVTLAVFWPVTPARFH